VVAAYFQNYTIGDIGPNYEPAAGYIGTLAPGSAAGIPLDEESEVGNLPKKVGAEALVTECHGSQYCL
jgi:hypothetical protein